MSPVGAPGQLDVQIKEKSYGTASGGRLHVLGNLAITLASGEVAALAGIEESGDGGLPDRHARSS